MGGVYRARRPYLSELINVACWRDEFASVHPVQCLEPVPGGWPIRHPEDCGPKCAGTYWGYEWATCPAQAIEDHTRLSFAMLTRRLSAMGAPTDATTLAAWAVDYLTEIEVHANKRSKAAHNVTS